MKTITVYPGRTAMVDDEDYEYLSKHRWKLYTRQHHGEFAGVSYRGFQTIAMHRLILNAQYGEIVIHIDGNGLNNQKTNLKKAEKGELIHMFQNRNNAFKYRGVGKKGNEYFARICYKGKTYQKYGFNTPEQAAEAYNEMAKQYYGVLAKLNERVRV